MDLEQIYKFVIKPKSKYHSIATIIITYVDYLCPLIIKL
jgi:hypothetical protein